MWNYIALHWWLWVALAPVKVALAMTVRKGYKKAVSARRKAPDYALIAELERDLGFGLSSLRTAPKPEKSTCKHKLHISAHDDDGKDYHDHKGEQKAVRKCLMCRQHILVHETPTRERSRRHTELLITHLAQVHQVGSHCLTGTYWRM